MKLQLIVIAICSFLSLPFAQTTKSLLFYKMENHASLTDAEAGRINEVFQNRIRSIKGWSLVDSTVIRTQGITGPCDQECKIALAQKLGSNMLLTGTIEPTEDAGVVEVRVSLLDPNSWKEVQREVLSIGPDIEKDLGKVSALAKLFDPASASTTQEAQSPEDKTSTAANWVLGGGALAVLAIVLYSLL